MTINSDTDSLHLQRDLMQIWKKRGTFICQSNSDTASLSYSNKAMCQLNEKLKSSQKYNFPLLQENISESSLKILGFKQKSIFKKSKIL